MSEEVINLMASKKADIAESAKLLKQLHDEILAYINLANTKKFDELITKMSSSTRSPARGSASQ